MKKLLLAVVAIVPAAAFAQVGIGNTSPKSQLDISASNPAAPTNQDGLLIPRIDTFPAIAPTANQNGMTVFLTTAVGANQPGFYYWDHLSTSWKGVGTNTANAWSLSGNTGYNPGTSFIGSIDSKEVFFRHTNQPSGVIGAADTSFGYRSLGAYSLTARNSAFGTLALENNTVSTENSVLGSEALNANTAGSKNVAIGNRALYKQAFSNAGAAYDTRNVAVGYGAMYATNATNNVNGSGNVGVGHYALSNNGTGISNIAIGQFALGAAASGGGSMTGNWNIGIGGAALKSNVAGSGNIAVGAASLGYNNSGIDNIGIGTDALFYSTNLSNGTAVGTRAMENYGIFVTGTNDNVAFGYEALRGTNTVAAYTKNAAVGYQSMVANISGSGNSAMGYQSLVGNTSGANNTGVGNLVLSGNVSGSSNTAVGNQALKLATASNNTAIGDLAGATITNGSNNIAIGAGSNVLTAAGSNQLSIANVIYGANMDNLVASPAYLSIGAAPNPKYKWYNYANQITANGDGQYGIYSYRERNSLNHGSGYGVANTNAAIAGTNWWGENYTFGTIGYTYYDFNRCGGVLGSHAAGTIWSSLAYKASNDIGYAVYGTSAMVTGTGRFSQPQSQFSIGGGFYGGVIGSWSKGDIGNVSSGKLFAAYNSGDEYTAGRQIELIDTGNSKTAAFTMTSTESVVYKKGKIALVNGSARVTFDANYVGLLGDVPIVTTTPMGPCNGIYIESVDKTGFTVRELNNGTSNIAISWIAVGDRIDARQSVNTDVLANDFDINLNEVMFNENNKAQTAKGIWSESNKIQFGTIPQTQPEAGQKQ